MNFIEKIVCQTKVCHIISFVVHRERFKMHTYFHSQMNYSTIFLILAVCNTGHYVKDAISVLVIIIKDCMIMDFLDLRVNTRDCHMTQYDIDLRQIDFTMKRK